MSLFDILRKDKNNACLCDDDRLSWLRLARTNGVGAITFYKLLETYGSPSKALEALPDIAARGAGKKAIVPAPMEQVEAEYKRLHKAGGQLLAACEDAYPDYLSTIEDAPPVISILGDASILQKKCIGIVGARNASMHACELAKEMAHDLSCNGWAIASGLARGIDTSAHVGSIEYGTIAVVAGGIDIIYPRENEKLSNEIAEKGVIVAESPMGQKPFSQSFPRRNRIISGLSKGLVVVECSMRSGSLITARTAGEQNRDVMAVPCFPKDPRSYGTNHLLRQGATLVRDARDVMEAVEGDMIPTRLDLDVQKARKEALKKIIQDETPKVAKTPPQGLEGKVEEYLSFTPIEIDKLIRETGASAAEIQSALLDMELCGKIKRLHGGRVVLV